MNRYPIAMPNLTEFSDWNRYPLPSTFRGWVDHTPSLLRHTNLAVDDQRHIEQLAQSPFSDIVLGPMDGNDPALERLLGQLHARAPALTPWLEVPLHAERRQLVSVLERHPQCALQLPLQLSSGDCAQIGQQLETLRTSVEPLQQIGTALCLVLQDASCASPSQLHACIEFARHRRIQRVTLCDQHARLTPLGVRNLLEHLLEHFPDLPTTGPALAFKGNDRHGLAVANSMAAISHGIHFVHGAILSSTQQQGHLELQLLLRHYLINQRPRIGHYAELSGQLTAAPKQTALLRYAQDAPPPKVQSLPIQRATHARPRQCSSRPHLIFKVSADDWHVRLLIQLDDQQLDLGERVHHYVLLLLAREFCQQQQARRQQCATGTLPDPLSLGWIERERLHKMIGDSEAQLNVKLCRASKQIGCSLASAGIEGYKPILTRVGSIRLACADFSIFKDSSLEYQVHNWTPLAAPGMAQACLREAADLPDVTNRQP